MGVGFGIRNGLEWSSTINHSTAPTCNERSSTCSHGPVNLWPCQTGTQAAPLATSWTANLVYKLCLLMHYIHTSQAPQYLSNSVSTISSSGNRYKLRSLLTLTYSRNDLKLCCLIVHTDLLLLLCGAPRRFVERHLTNLSLYLYLYLYLDYWSWKGLHQPSQPTALLYISSR